ncbi:MAG: cation:proton antiporter [Clostridia bacterium]|nr:cation:proton antiporter [Clostridia bacterium]
MIPLNTYMYLALMILFGMFFGRMAKHVGLPNVTGYLVGGLLLGPSVLGIVPADALSGFDIISEVALGFIAFTIGNEFKISYFKRVGRAPIVIAFLEAFVAVIFVISALLIAGFQLPFSIVLGSIAAATAPAATIMVIKQYNAKGPVTETLLSVVALDDAAALILFGISVAIGQALMSPGDTAILPLVIKPFIEIFGAIICGFLFGLLFTLPLRYFKKSGNRLSIIVGFIFAGIGISKMFGLSSLLLCMAMGAALANVSSVTKELVKISDSITPPIFLLFFVTSGAELQLSVLPSIGVAGVIYVIFRVIGKYAGAYFGAVLCKTDKNIKKYLGPALIPQAGVAIGLSLVATTVVPQFANEIRGIILCGTLIYEMIGPGVAKWSLKKAGEICG